MTNKIVLRTTDEYMGGFRPIYRPLWGLFMGNAVQYSAEVGTHTFREVKTVGDIRAKDFTPKDTELKQIAVAEGSKTFKKYFKGVQYIQSQFQDQRGVQEMIGQVLDEHNRQADDLLLGDSINSGIYTSADENYELKNSYEVQKDANDEHLADMYAKVVSLAQEANVNAGRKVVMFYGSTVLPKFGGLFAQAVRPFRGVLAEGLGADYSILEMPADCTPSNANGMMILNMDQIRLHWTAMPQLRNQGINEEKQYYWFNFLLGSMMADLRVDKAIIRQPLTFEA